MSSNEIYIFFVYISRRFLTFRSDGDTTLEFRWTAYKPCVHYAIETEGEFEIQI